MELFDVNTDNVTCLVEDIEDSATIVVDKIRKELTVYMHKKKTVQKKNSKIRAACVRLGMDKSRSSSACVN